jgi:hypothetical protein
VAASGVLVEARTISVVGKAGSPQLASSNTIHTRTPNVYFISHLLTSDPGISGILNLANPTGSLLPERQTSPPGSQRPGAYRFAAIPAMPAIEADRAIRPALRRQALRLPSTSAGGRPGIAFAASSASPPTRYISEFLIEA